ncbi:MAG TPA: hypothetical protein VK444_06690 [Methanobacteriaceae archaeon]|nr:hypothetical protein [Methanobacteriaceae archaeon]
MIAELILYPLAGFFMKISDDAQDEKNNTILGAITGIICVLAIGYLVVTSSDAATIFIAILIGTLLAGKIDHWGHIITLIIGLGILAIFGLPPLGILTLAICIAATYLDEFGNDAPWLDGEKKLTTFFRYRFVLKITVFALALGGLIQIFYPGFTIPGLRFFQPATFIYFLLFDLAYELAGLTFNTLYDGINRNIRRLG